MMALKCEWECSVRVCVSNVETIVRVGHRPHPITNPILDPITNPHHTPHHTHTPQTPYATASNSLLPTPLQTSLAALWRGDKEDSYGRLAVVHTAAAALLLMQKTDSIEDAIALADVWWEARNREQLPC